MPEKERSGRRWARGDSFYFLFFNLNLLQSYSPHKTVAATIICCQNKKKRTIEKIAFYSSTLPILQSGFYQNLSIKDGKYCSRYIEEKSFNKTSTKLISRQVNLTWNFMELNFKRPKYIQNLLLETICHFQLNRNRYF